MGDERAWKAEVERLTAENRRLTRLLEQHRIEWRQREPEEQAQSLTRSEVKPLTAEQRVAIFSALFRGREDVYPVRWESKATGKSGYAPACAR